MNMVLNDNWREIFKDMVGPVQIALGDSFHTIINKLIKKVPYDIIFPWAHFRQPDYVHVIKFFMSIKMISIINKHIHREEINS